MLICGRMRMCGQWRNSEGGRGILVWCKFKPLSPIHLPPCLTWICDLTSWSIKTTQRWLQSILVGLHCMKSIHQSNDGCVFYYVTRHRWLIDIKTKGFQTPILPWIAPLRCLITGCGSFPQSVTPNTRQEMTPEKLNLGQDTLFLSSVWPLVWLRHLSLAEMWRK